MATPRTLTILTGASRGMGHAMALQLLARPDSSVLTIARHPSEDLLAASALGHTTLTQWQADLTDAVPVAERLAHWLQGVANEPWSAVRLINNAALLPPNIAPLAATPPAVLAQVLRVGLEAPMALTASFLHATKDWPVPRMVLNISSGLARLALASQAPYSAAKAGLEHFTRCLSLEEALKPHGAKVCAMAPGVIDTGMQTQMRSTAQEDFPNANTFTQLHDSGRLLSAQAAATMVLAHLDGAHFGKQVIAEIQVQ